jgi:hypothetical protein
MKTVLLGDRRYKLLFLDLIPFDEKQAEALKESIEDKQGVLVPVVCWKERHKDGEDTVVDGAHRVLFASELGLAKVPLSQRSYETEEDAKDDCERLNIDRRHVTPQEQKARREARLERVAAARAEGQSVRTIAEQEGVSPGQIARDVKDALTNVSPETPSEDVKEKPPETVVGKNGVNQPATHPPILCDRCKRVGAVKDCEACKEARKPKRSTLTKPKDPLKDHFGNDVPEKLRNVWGDPWIQDTYDYLCVMSENFRKERFASGMSKRAKHFPFFKSEDFEDGCGFVIQYLDELIEHMKLMRPAGVCPACEGAKCNKCKMSGFVPRELYKELKQKAKEKAK